MASPTTVTSPARPFTFEDLEGMPDDGYRREIIGGSLIVTPSPRRTHQRVVGKLLLLLSDTQSEGLEVLVGPFDWRPAGADVFEPDLLVVRDADVDEQDLLRHGANPVLAAEVLSPSNRSYDLVTKRAAYEAVGLATYWVVDPTACSLLMLRLGHDGTYHVDAELSGDDTVAVTEPFEVNFPVADLFLR